MTIEEFPRQIRLMWLICSCNISKQTPLPLVLPDYKTSDFSQKDRKIIEREHEKELASAYVGYSFHFMQLK